MFIRQTGRTEKKPKEKRTHIDRQTLLHKASSYCYPKRSNGRK